MVVPRVYLVLPLLFASSGLCWQGSSHTVAMLPSPTPSMLLIPSGEGESRSGSLTLFVALHPTIPTFLVLSWEISTAIEIVRANNVQSFLITVSDIQRRVPTSNDATLQLLVPFFEVVLPGSVFEYTLGPLESGTDLTVCISVRDTFVDGIAAPDGRPCRRISLPTCDLVCNYPAGFVPITCSGCICQSSAFSGPSCRDPQFYPKTVSAWPTSALSLRVQWEFDEDTVMASLEGLGVRLMHFQIEIINNRTIDRIPISRRSLEVRLVEPGVEYELTVGTVARNTTRMILITATAPSIRVLIDENLFTSSCSEMRVPIPTIPAPSPSCTLNMFNQPPTSDSDSDSNSNSDSDVAAGFGVVGGLFFLLVGGVCIVVAFLCVWRKRASRRKKMATANLSATPSFADTPLTLNPAYGLSHSANGAISSSQQPRGSRAQLLVHSESPGGDDTTGSGTFTYDYISPEL